MRTVFNIFKGDTGALAKHFFAFAIIIAISILPALYAWFNIYANFDPYGNTGNIRIALASRDPGIDLENGKHVNKAKEVFEDLKESDSIDWQFPETAEKAIGGVESGEYYAAVIFEDNFTYNMYHFRESLSDTDAALTYYENDKKNAVAAKITETAAGNLLEKINTEYLQTVLETFFTDANDLAEELAEDDTADEAAKQLRNLKGTLDSYDKAVDAFLANGSNVQSAINSTRKHVNETNQRSSSALRKSEKNLADAERTLNRVSGALKEQIKDVDKAMADFDSALADLKESGAVEEGEEILEKAKQRGESLVAKLENLRGLLPDKSEIPGMQAMINALDNMVDRTKGVEEILEGLPDNNERVDEAIDTIKRLKELDLTESVDTITNDLNSTIEALSPLLESLNGMLGDVDPVLRSTGSTVTSIDDALIQLQRVFSAASSRLDDLINVLENADGDERVQMVLDILGGDSDLYSRFFSSLVDVEVEEIYQVPSYGAAMAPFYSVLAIWVGGVILVSILKTAVDRKKFPGATDAQCFFGRLIIFLLIGQFQAAVIVLGDIFLLGCAPVHPWLMWAAAAVTSIVFVTLIYALTLAFGDVGKAIVVVIMVVQIAGSSGSYPIEILPEIFSKIYRFFPFPYAINAMREALCGTYKFDYLIYLGELLLFGLLGLAIGLVVRRPFMGINRFVSEKLEETEVL